MPERPEPEPPAEPPIEPARCRRRAQNAIEAGDAGGSVAWSLLAISGQLAELLRVTKRSR